MANSDNEPNAYEATPVAVSMPGIPLPTRGEWSSKGAAVQGGALRVTGVTTPMASLTQAAMQTEDLLEGYCKQVRKDVRTVLELLAIEPALMRVKWVRRAYERLMEWERAKRKRGRPKGSYRINPAIVLGFVRALRASGRARTDHRAVLILARSGVFTYDQGLHGLRAAKQDPRMRPVLVPPAPAEQPLSATRAAELLRQAIQAQPGMCLRYELGGDAVMRLTKVVTRDGEEQPYPAVPPSS